MPHNKELVEVKENLNCSYCGKRAKWWVLTSSVRYPNKGVLKDIVRKVGPYCQKCCKEKEFRKS